MFRNIFTRKELKNLEDLKKTVENLPNHISANMKKVEKMDKKTYLKYYIKVLEDQIEKASRILKEKKRELKKLN